MPAVRRNARSFTNAPYRTRANRADLHQKDQALPRAVSPIWARARPQDDGCIGEIRRGRRRGRAARAAHGERKAARYPGPPMVKIDAFGGRKADAGALVRIGAVPRVRIRIRPCQSSW